MIMAIMILKRSYTLTKYTSVGMITLGTIICTFASSENVVSFNELFLLFLKPLHHILSKVLHSSKKLFNLS